MFVLIAYYSDGCTYTSDHIVAVFEDKAVADLVCEEMSKCAQKERKRGHDLRRDLPDVVNGGFRVDSILHYRAESESRVMGIVKEIMTHHFPRE